MTARDPHHCPTCADAADRAVIRSIDGRNAVVTVDDDAPMTIAIDLVPGAAVGDTVLVHQGVAISKIAAETTP